MATSTNEWIRAAWKSEMQKEHTSLKQEAEMVMRKVDAPVISLVKKDKLSGKQAGKH